MTKSLSFLTLLGAASAFAVPLKVKVGVVLPMSGPVATFGIETMNGMKLAAQEINKTAKDVQVELVLEDDKSEGTDAANAIKKLINVNKVNIVLGSVPSSNTNAMAPIAQGAKIPLMTPASTNVDITKVGDYISRICFLDDFQGLAMAQFAYNDLKAKTAALVIENSSDYSVGLAKAFKDSFTKLGGKIVVDVSYTSKDQDFSSQLTRIRTRRPDVIFAPGYYQEIGNMIRQAKTMGIKTTFLGGDGWSSPQLFELAGDAIVGHYFAAHFAADHGGDNVKTFVKGYQKQFKTLPSDMSALGYDSVYIVADAVRRAGMKVDAEPLKKAINETKGYVGVTGTITLDAGRNAIKPLSVLETSLREAHFKQLISP